MNLRHVGYRAYQCVFGLGARLLPWRQPETITGPGSLADIPARLIRYGAHRPLMVASRRQCADPAFQQMLSRLEGYTLFSDIKPNPPVSTVEAAAALYRQAHCDSLVAVGGGSPMDTAKAAAALVGLSGDSEADRANAFIDAVFAMNARLGIPTGFTCIREADLPQMASWAAKEANPTYPVPVIYDRARFIRVIRQVMQ